MIHSLLRDRDFYPWQYHQTEHKCPDCETLLTRVDTSTMLICDKGHGPYFLV